MGVQPPMRPGPGAPWGLTPGPQLCLTPARMRRRASWRWGPDGQLGRPLGSPCGSQWDLVMRSPTASPLGWQPRPPALAGWCIAAVVCPDLVLGRPGPRWGERQVGREPAPPLPGWPSGAPSVAGDPCWPGQAPSGWAQQWPPAPVTLPAAGGFLVAGQGPARASQPLDLQQGQVTVLSPETVGAVRTEVTEERGLLRTKARAGQWGLGNLDVGGWGQPEQLLRTLGRAWLKAGEIQVTPLPPGVPGGRTQPPWLWG